MWELVVQVVTDYVHAIMHHAPSAALASASQIRAAGLRSHRARSLSKLEILERFAQNGDLHLLIVDLATRKNPFLHLVAHAHHCAHGGIWAERELDGAEKLPHDHERLLGDLRRSDGVELFVDDARLRIFDTGRGGADADWLERSATAIAVEFVENGASVEGRRHASWPKTIFWLEHPAGTGGHSAQGCARTRLAPKG